MLFFHHHKGDCTALMESSANGHSDVVQLLISAGARLEENDFVSTTLLYYI